MSHTKPRNRFVYCTMTTRTCSLTRGIQVLVPRAGDICHLGRSVHSAATLSGSANVRSVQQMYVAVLQLGLVVLQMYDQFCKSTW